MGKWKLWFGNFERRMTRKKREKPQIDGELSEKLRLYREICEAHQEWVDAQEKMNYVKDIEQIDYVIYLQEAAEKRYEMLLKQAKRIDLNVMELYRQIGKKPLHSTEATNKAMEG